MVSIGTKNDAISVSLLSEETFHVASIHFHKALFVNYSNRGGGGAGVQSGGGGVQF